MTSHQSGSFQGQRRESLQDELQAIENLIRSEEEVVLQELHSDHDQTQRLQELRARTQEIFEQYDRSKAKLAQLEKDLIAFKAQRGEALGSEDLKACAELLSTVRRRQTKIEKNQPTRAQVMRELDTAVDLTQQLSDLGSHRDYTIMHAIKGLANTKALHADGQTPKAEVFDKLRAVTSETQSLSVSHTNMRVRQGHCLRVATRLMSDIEPVDTVDLEPHVARLVGGTSTANSEQEGPGPQHRETARARQEEKVEDTQEAPRQHHEHQRPSTHQSPQQSYAAHMQHTVTADS